MVAGQATRIQPLGFVERNFNRPHPGYDCGVRAPTPDETPLSEAEVIYFLRGE